MKNYYTNGELYDLLHPGEMNLPYVYDNFAWPNCDVSVCLGLCVMENYLRGRRFAFSPAAFYYRLGL